MDEKRMQTSESFLLSAVLSLSGGLQDAYTYNLRDHVFANAQTGNVVLMSQHLMLGQWRVGLQYFFPLLAFALGILVAERVDHRYKQGTLHWRQIILMAEIALLFAVGLIPTAYNTAATMLVSFVCAMQVQAFRKVHGYGYASTMCIGNLRSAMESLSVYLRSRTSDARQKTRYYFGVILFFAIGAGGGGVLCGFLGLKTIWLSSALLLVGCVMMHRRYA